ncbi:MAG: aminotransferase class V-fold PLP-dependent enzyme [Micromonosporaceae bacterium]|nr:aminotransferase class V-fold PLP-dependent enzyme [Micromonosporaceae bacterium]
MDVERLRSHFDFVRTGRVVTNNAASTQPPRELLDLYRSLVPWYENVHRGQSGASRRTTGLFESAYDTIAGWLNAPGRRTIATYRNTTEAINAVMYSLLTEFRDGDNVVTTMMEHNSNFVPWYALGREILPRFGRRVQCRLARFDQAGRLDLAHLASLVDSRTKLVCCTGASNFFGSKPDLGTVRRIADASGYRQPDGTRRSLLLVDGAQQAPSSAVDVRALDLDYYAFSFHKMLAPFGVGVLYAKEHLLRGALPFLYGGDMIAEGQVAPDRVAYNDLPWKYAAGTPNILGVIVSAQALRLLVDLVDPADPAPGRPYFGSGDPLPHPVVRRAMAEVGRHTRQLTERALSRLRDIAGLTVYGPPTASERTPLVSFTIAGISPFTVAEALDRYGVESRAGCHCATLAHRALGLDPPASCRLSFAVYNTVQDVDRATGAVARIAETATQGWVGSY